MDKKTLINILVEGLKEEIAPPLDLFQCYLQNKKLPHEKIEGIFFHPYIINLYLYSIEEKCNKESMPELVNQIANKFVFPCVLFQEIKDGDKEFDVEQFKKAEICLKDILDLIKKLNKN